MIILATTGNNKFIRVSFKVITVAVITLLCAVNFQLVESAEIITDRPDQTESSSSLKPGVVQLEVGWGYTFDKSTNSYVAPMKYFKR